MYWTCHAETRLTNATDAACALSDHVSRKVHARFQKDLLEWTRENARSFPWRSDEVTPYQILVAEMFLNVTRSDVVADVYPDFLDQFPELADLENASRGDIIDLIRPLGLYEVRADALKTLAEELESTSVPKTRDALLELPRVGEYVANAVLCMAYGEDVPMLDRNVARIYSRLHGLPIDQSNLRQTDWDLAKDLVPEGDARRYNLGLLDFASEVCRADDPRCEDCFASSYCTYYSRA